MLKIVCLNPSNPIPIKTVVDGLMNTYICTQQMHQLPSLQCSINRQNALAIGDSSARRTQLNRQLTYCSHNCNCDKCFATARKCALRKEINAITTYSVSSKAENIHLDGLFSAPRYKKLLLTNQFVNYIFARNYSKKSKSKPACGPPGSKKGGGKGGKGDKKDNLAAVLFAVDDLRLEQRPIPKISDTDVLLAMDLVGICGSDVHYWEKGRIGDFVLKKPMIIGHEGAGVVEEVGKKVKNLKKGDRVAIEPGVPCRMCDFCKRAQYNLCHGMTFCATPPVDGNLMRYYKHPADFCYKIPPHMTMEEAALLEPLSVGVHASLRAGVSVGSEILIFGSGPIGLTTLTAAKAMGASKALVMDMKEDRLKVAKKMGADHTILIKGDEDPKDLAKKIIKKNDGSMPNNTFDCVGSELAIKTGIFATRSGGCIVLIGMGDDEASLPLANALSREVDIRGIFRYCNDYKSALALVASNKVKALNHMITHHFDIKETEKAFTTVRCNEGGAIKVIIHVQPKDKNNPKKDGKDGGKKKGKC